MIDWENFEENNYDYSPNDLAEMSINNPDKHRRIVEQNIPAEMSVEDWQQKNINYMNRLLKGGELE